MRRIPGILLGVVAVIVGLVLIAPTLIVIPLGFTSGQSLAFPPPGLSLQWFENLFDSAKWMRALGNSVLVALGTMVVATVLGTTAALGLARSRSRFAGALSGLMLAPAIVPAVVFAIGIFFVLARLGLAGTMPGMIIAHSVLAIPLVFVSVSANIAALDPVHDLAAASLGASPVQRFFHVLLPLLAPGIIVGAIYSLTTSWDELVVSIFLVSPTLKTLPVEMWDSLRLQSDPTLAAVATMLISLVVFVALLSVSVRWLVGPRKKGVAGS